MRERSPCRRALIDKLVTLLWLLSVGLWALPAEAAELGPSDSPLSLEVHGFISQGFLLTVGNEYLAAKSTRGSFEFAEVGLNFTKRVTDSLRVGAQLFARQLGTRGDYSAEFDWGYLDYRFRNWLGLRAGRLKIPYGLHNEVQDVDVARVPILLPPSVYPLQTREILFAQTGVELYGFARVGDAGALDYRLFGGTIFLDDESLTPRGVPFQLDFSVPYVVGGRLIWETPLAGLRIGGSVQAVRLETDVLIPSMPPIRIENDSLLWSVFAEYSLRELVLTAEYARWSADQRSDNAAISPPLRTTSERAYAQASYRFGTWFQTSLYHSMLFPDVDQRKGRQNYQHDLALTLRFDMNAHWLVKLEGHYMLGTAGLLDPLRINPPDISTADRRWAAFFAKTTAYF